MDLMEKLTILGESAKYDVACTSSGNDRSGKGHALGSAVACGICHSFSSDGRCISLLKVLFSNCCIYDCKYCINHISNQDTPRASFTPRELADLTIAFYRRNYIEGLFLSSGVIRSPDHTCELLIRTLRILREEYDFAGYIHVKAIPGASPDLLAILGQYADRMSVNIELPSESSLRRLAPDKSKSNILTPMGFITRRVNENKEELVHFRHAPKFVPAGQSTQMIVGATPESDYHILRLSQSLYDKYHLKRVFFSAYMPLNNDSNLPSLDTKPPLLREHRLYQADWLLRFYHFRAEEILDEANPNFNPLLDPKCNWALHHLDYFPVEIRTADEATLLRVPGIGPRSAKRILMNRRSQKLTFEHLQKMGVVLKRARYFITCGGKLMDGLNPTNQNIFTSLTSPADRARALPQEEQLTFLPEGPDISEVRRCLIS
ncbi:MAG: putative DNA modification/repair radical SAM protein [Clostridia bacterium]|nr:putative DNA modification/repair radical SAM protein [Clostridia bacterium]